MSQIDHPSNGSLATAIVPKLRIERTVASHSGSSQSELAGRILTEGGYVDSRNEIEFADAIVGPAGPQGPDGDPGVFVGPTPPADTSLIWVDTS